MSRDYELRQPRQWCKANLCSHPAAAPDRLFCDQHWARLVEVAPELVHHLEGIDPRPLLLDSLPMNVDTLGRLEACAEAVELIGAQERKTVVNQYRLAASRMAERLRRAEPEPEPPAPPVQGELINTNSIRRGPWA